MVPPAPDKRIYSALSSGRPPHRYLLAMRHGLISCGLVLTRSDNGEGHTNIYINLLHGVSAGRMHHRGRQNADG